MKKLNSGWLSQGSREKSDRSSSRFGSRPGRLCRLGSASTPTRGSILARTVREYHIPDFSNWKDHEAFEAAFAKLLEDLKAEESPRQ